MLASPNKDKLETLAAGIVHFPMEVHCEARSFDKLLGYVDLHVLSTDGLCSIKEPPEYMSAAVCQLEPASEEQIQTYTLMQASQEEAKVEEFMTQITDFTTKLTQAEPSTDQVGAFLTQITEEQDNLQAMHDALTVVQQSVPKLKQAFTEALKTATRVQRSLRTDMRRQK